jgi:hypothetical protein
MKKQDDTSEAIKLFEAERNAREQPWFAVRSLLRDTEKGVYEERTVLFRAKSHDEAIKKAEAEAAEYCEALETYEPAGYYDTFHLFEEHIGDGSEIFSLTRNTSIPSSEYIDRYLDSGIENRKET